MSVQKCEKCRLERDWKGDIDCPVCGARDPAFADIRLQGEDGPIQGSSIVPKGTAIVANLDALDWLRQLPDEFVDLIVTDIAYESLEKHRKIGTTTRLKNSKASSNQWFEIFPNSRILDLFEECYRVLKKNRHLYFFCDAETMFVAKPLGEQAGFHFWKPVIWDKVAIGMGYHYRARCERILFFEKGKRKINDLSVPDVLAVKRVYGGYPTEKPVELLKVLVRQSTSEGETVLDPFCGSGSAGVAAVTLGRHFLGNDLCAEAVDITVGRTRGITKAEYIIRRPDRCDQCAVNVGVQCSACYQNICWTCRANSHPDWLCPRCRQMHNQKSGGESEI